MPRSLVRIRCVAWRPMSLSNTLVLLVLAALLSSAQVDSEQRLRIEARDGATHTLALAEVNAKSLSEWHAIAVRPEGFEAPTLRADLRTLVEVQLNDGDTLHGAAVGGTGEQLHVELAGALRLGIDAELLARVLFTGQVSPAAARALEAPPRGDRLYWARPAGLDCVDGTLEAFSDAGVGFESALGKRVFPWNEIAALYVEALDTGPAKRVRTAASVCVDLADGGRLHGELSSLTGTSARLRWNSGTEVEIALASIVEVTLDDGTLEFLSSVTPDVTREGWPAGDELGMKWPVQIDRAVTGDALRCGGRSWSRGLGVHAPSRLQWNLDGSWKALRGAVAVDDSVLLLPYRGSVEFALYLNGADEPAWRSGRVRGGDAPLELPALPLVGVRSLALQVDMDERSYVADRANWLRLLLVR